MKLLPASLFGRTMLVLIAGLIIVQIGSVAIHLFDRGSSVYRLASLQIASHIAQTVRILNRLPPAEREKVVQEVSSPQLRATLSREPVAVASGFTEHDRYEAEFTEEVQRQIGARWPIRVDINPQPRPDGATAGPFERWMARHFYFLLPEPFAIVVQVVLQDGTVAVFDVNVPQEPLRRFENLVPLLLLLMLACFALSGFLVRMITASLDRLAHAADAIGRNPATAPLPDSGPSEIHRVIAAFNRMQERVRSYLVERSRLLTAISHDLKTPITRLRLRAEMLPDAQIRSKMLRDLDEMQTMVGTTLEFFRTSGKDAQRQPLDVGALIESVCEDRREAGQALSVRGAALGPYRADPQALRRCLENLVENAVRYGGGADIEVIDSPGRLSIAVSDRGPGIPEAELERVFEPFYRLDASRNMDSGGTGLGLSIARDIARWHGGDVILRNASGGGLIAELALPR
ncbi:MAG TPA: ATP-binding protein [Burkholderiales bacterium]|nr:ATP-binding protein [Burkholderiales bacterium]